jgi:hypothetical protein
MGGLLGVENITDNDYDVGKRLLAVNFFSEDRASPNEFTSPR